MMKKIRVMHLIHQLGAGGAENGIVNLVNHINPDRFETSICAFVGNGALTERVERSRTRLFELNKRSGNDFNLPFRLRKVLKKWNPHIVHTHAWGTLCEGLIGAKLAGVPVIIHGEHGTIQEKKLNILVQRLFWNMTDQVLSVSRLHGEKLAETIGYPKNKIKIIANGVDTNRFIYKSKNEKVRKSLGINEKDIVLGTVARLIPVKNQELLIRAFANLVESYPNSKLLFVGDGPLKEELTSLVSTLGISHHVIFLGRRTDIPELLGAMDIFVLSSISEGMSNTILEAMSCNLSVVATDVGGNSEVVENGVTGLLVPNKDREKMVKSLMGLVADSEKREVMGERGRKNVEKCFSIRKMVDNYESIYESLLSKNKIRI